jgi:flagellar secretion chaperone FliS
MTYNRAAMQAYSQAQHTVGKTRQVVMLYDGAIRYLQQAREAIEHNRIEERFRLLSRVSEILMGLQSSLDFEKGENVARVLYDFYSVQDHRITTIQRTNNSNLCDSVIEDLKVMRTTWNEIDQASSDRTAPHVTESMPTSSMETVPSPEAISMIPSNFSA